LSRASRTARTPHQHQAFIEFPAHWFSGGERGQKAAEAERADGSKRNGRHLETEDENLAEFTEMAAEFLTRQLPILRSLGIP